MANPPDVVSVAHIYGRNQTTKLTTNTATDIMTAVATNYSHKVNQIIAVSYTHLTLPTIYSV